MSYLGKIKMSFFGLKSDSLLGMFHIEEKPDDLLAGVIQVFIRH